MISGELIFAALMGMGFASAVIALSMVVSRAGKVSGRAASLGQPGDDRHPIDRELKPFEKLSIAVECFPNTFLLMDTEDRIVFSNAAWRTQFARVPTFTVPGTPYRDFLRAAALAGHFPESLGSMEDWLRDRLRSHANPGEPLETMREDGSWMLINEQRLPDGGIMIVSSDITERKRTENALRESEALLNEAQRIAKLSSWMWDEVEDREIYRSGADSRIYGLNNDDKLTASFEDFLAQVHGDDRDRVETVINDAYRSRSGYDIEYRLQRPDGEIRHIAEHIELIMQRINRDVDRTVFMVLLLGMSALSPLLIGYAYFRVTGPASILIMAGGGLYLAGVFVVSLIFNVPMNQRLDAMDYSTTEAATYWSDSYRPRWTFWNYIRAIASAASAICYLAAVVWLARG